MLCPLSQEDVVDDGLPDLVVRVEIHADDDAGDQDDERALDQLLLARPLDLVQLAGRLADEVGRAEAVRLARRLPLRACRRGTSLRRGRGTAGERRLRPAGAPV